MKSRTREFWAEYGPVLGGVLAIFAIGVITLVLGIMLSCKATSSASPPVNRAAETVRSPDGSTTTRTVESTGPAYAARGDRVAAETQAKAGAVAIRDGQEISAGASSGAGDVTAKIAGFPALGWIGVLLIAAGIGSFWSPIPLPRGVSMTLLGSGGVLLAVGFFPGLLLWGLVAVAVAGGVYLLWLGKDAKANREALRAVVAGVEASPEAVASAVKTKIGEQADAADKATIEKIKIADNL